MNSFMVVATFKDGVTQEEIRALIPAEQVQAKLLEAQGAIGSIKVAMPRRTVFIEAFGQDDEAVLRTIQTLPLAVLWDTELFPTTPPAGPNT
jgi:hypothetical protein